MAKPTDMDFYGKGTEKHLLQWYRCLARHGDYVDKYFF